MSQLLNCQTPENQHSQQLQTVTNSEMKEVWKINPANKNPGIYITNNQTCVLKILPNKIKSII